MNEAPQPVAPRALFLAFSGIGLRGFGGVAAWVYSTVVEEKRWLTAGEFAELLGVGQLLPGPNVTNFSTMLGYRLAGWRGAVAATLGLLLLPFFVVLGLGVLYQRFGQFPWVQGSLRGVLAVCTGLIFSTGFKLARSQPRNLRSLVFGVCAFLAVGWLGWPLPWVVVGTGLVALLSEWRAYK